jgi:hypothetical protein
LVLQGIIHPVVSVSISRSIPFLLVDYYFSRASSAQWSIINTDYWADDTIEGHYSTNRRGIDLVIETLTTGRMIS